MRPGIEDLAHFGVHEGNHDTYSGLVIPYDNNFFRIRLTHPIGDKKYHQKVDSGVHIWQHESTLKSNKLIVVEGEFKAMALAEAGYYAVGMSGFYGCMQKDSTGKFKLHNELNLKGVDTIILQGDSDTAVNFQFSDAAVKLRACLPADIKLIVPVLGFNFGKGVDDIRAYYNCGPKFLDYYNKIIDNAIVINNKTTADELAISILKQAKQSMQLLLDDELTSVRRKFVKLVACLSTLQKGDAAAIAKEVFGLSSAALNRAVKDALSERSEASEFEHDTKVFDKLLLVGTEWFKSMETEREGEVPYFERTRSDIVSVMLRKAGYGELPLSPETPVCGGREMITEYQAAMGYLGDKRHVGSIGFKLFGDYGMVRDRDGRMIFNQCRHEWTTPADGDYNIDSVEIRRTIAFLKALLVSEEQIMHFLYLLSDRYKKASSGDLRKCNAVMLVGPASAGKSFTIDYILSRIHGQKSAGDGMRMFRGEIGGASVLQHAVIKVSDQNVGNDKDAEKLREGLLQYLAEFDVGARLMYSDVKTTEVFNMFAFSSNPGGATLNILRGAHKDLISKLAVYVCGGGLMECPALTKDEVALPSKWFEEELPYFLAFLKQLQMPESYYHPRFGILPYMSPEVQTMLGVSKESIVVKECIESFLLLKTKDIDIFMSATQIYSKLINRYDLAMIMRSIRPEKFADYLTELSHAYSFLVQDKVYLNKSGAVKNHLFKLLPLDK